MTQPDLGGATRTSAHASTASRTRGCSPGAARTSTTSRCRGCCTRTSCAARTPGPRSAAIDTVGRARAARRARRVHRGRPEPRRQGAVAHVDRPAEPGDAAPAARRGRGALRRRPGRARRRRRAARSPRTRPISSRSTTNRCPPSSTTPTAEHADRARARAATAPTSSARSPGCPRRALDDVFAAAAHVTTETIYQQACAAGADGRRAA